MTARIAQGRRQIAQGIGACMAALVLTPSWARGAPAAGASAPLVCAPAAAPAAWPLWKDFVQQHVQADGRVIDHSLPQKQSTSEGQSYGMFFALVAGDAAQFDRMWRWSIANLAGGDITARLPAWRWGLRDDGSWGVLDANSASDSNLWFAYALLEAARVWNRPEYAEHARVLLARVVQEEVADLPGLGPMLLPGPQGFVRKQGEGTLWRLNSSYLPLPVLRALAQHDRAGPWQAIAANTARLLTATAPKGLVADWVAYEAREGERSGRFVTDPDKGDVGSYDAIRTYLWAAMTAPGDPLHASLLRATAGMARATAAMGAPPERVYASTGATQGAGPVGFAAALLPYLQVAGPAPALAQQQTRVLTQLLQAPASARPPYYDYVLGLFGTGWMEQRYRFLPSGRVQLRWETPCPRKDTPPR